MYVCLSVWMDGYILDSPPTPCLSDMDTHGCPRRHLIFTKNTHVHFLDFQLVPWIGIKEVGDVPLWPVGGMVNQKIERHIMCSSISCLCLGDPRGWDITVMPVGGTSHKIKDKLSLTRMRSVIESTGCDKMRLKIKYCHFTRTPKRYR